MEKTSNLHCKMLVSIAMLANCLKTAREYLTCSFTLFLMKPLHTLLLLIFLSSNAFAQSRVKSQEQQIQELILQSFNEIWSDLNASKMEKFYTTDFLALENGMVWNNDSIRARLEVALHRNPLPQRENSIELISIKVFEGRAWIAYKNHARFTVDQKIVREAHWLESAVAVMTPEGWRLEMLHATVLRKP